MAELKMVKILNLLLACFTLLSCIKDPQSISANPGAPPPRELTKSEQQLVQSDNRFGLKLFKKVVEQEVGNQNIFISPLSVSMALGMTYNGSAGATREAMESTLELSGLTAQEINESYKSLIELLTRLDPRVAMQIANSIWYRRELAVKPEFISLNRTYFNAEVNGLDFGAPGAPGVINDWVKRSTNGRIPQIVAGIDPLDVMFLINAIYFKGAWTYKFDPANTKDDLFTLPNGSQVSCKMMAQEGEFGHFSAAGFQAVELPYANGYFSMVILLPNPGKSVDSLIAAFSQADWDEWMSGLAKHKIRLQMPRFSLGYKITLNAALEALGMGIAFDPMQANFSEIANVRPENLYISEVLHKSFVEVNEEGTEAAAATSVTITVTSLPPLFRVDRPFVFVIREKHSGTLLFMGKIIEPVWE